MSRAVFRAMLLGLVRDRAALAMSFLLPVVFFLIFATIFSGATGEQLRLKVALSDEVGSEARIRLIEALRKDFQAPDAPFVIATIGFGGWEMEGNTLTVANAQLAVSGDKGKYPELKDNVKTVETRDLWRPAEESPRNQGYHYNQNAETYLNVGQAMGKGMLELLKANE